MGLQPLSILVVASSIVNDNANESLGLLDVTAPKVYGQ